MSTAYLLQHSTLFIFSLSGTMGLTSRAAKISGGGFRKKLRPVEHDSLSDKPVKSTLHEEVDRARAATVLTASKLDDITVPFLMTAGSSVHCGANFEVDRRYAVVGYRADATFLAVCLALDVTQERPLHTGGCHWDNVDVICFIRQHAYFDF